MSSRLLAIDLGSTKISAAIAQVDSGVPKVVGFSLQKSRGISKGDISNIEHVSQTIRACIKNAQNMAGLENLQLIDKTIVSFSDCNTTSISAHGVVNVGNSEISEKEIQRVFAAASTNAQIPIDSEILHIIPYKFMLDNREIEDPAGMSGSRLEVCVRIITADKSYIKNLKTTVMLAGVGVDYIVSSSYASALATLSDDEKQLGSVCIDMGGATCDLSIYIGNFMRFNKSIKTGSNHITSDLATFIHADIDACERIKIEHADTDPEADQENEGLKLEVKVLNNKMIEIPLVMINEVVRTRCIETLNILASFTKSSGFTEGQIASVVLTGGMTKLRNISKIAEQYFNNKVRIAKPRKIDSVIEAIHSEESSVIVGLILYGIGSHSTYEVDCNKSLRCRTKSVILYPSDTQDYPDSKSTTDLANLIDDRRPKDAKTDIIRQSQQKKNSAFSWVKNIANKLF